MRNMYLDRNEDKIDKVEERDKRGKMVIRLKTGVKISIGILGVET